MMRESDLIFDMGPRAGIHGGEIVAYGTYDEIMKNENRSRENIYPALFKFLSR